MEQQPVNPQSADQQPIDQQLNSQPVQPPVQQFPTKFCKHCGAKIPFDAVMCTVCGRQVEILASAPAAQPIYINNNNTNTNTNYNQSGGFVGNQKSKWVAVLLCFFCGWLGAHKFYEGKIGMGILYLFTAGLLGIGVLIDFITLLFKPDPYYV